MQFSIKDFFSKFNQILRKLRIWSHHDGHIPEEIVNVKLFLCSVAIIIDQMGIWDHVKLPG